MAPLEDWSSLPVVLLPYMQNSLPLRKVVLIREISNNSVSWWHPRGGGQKASHIFLSESQILNDLRNTLLASGPTPGSQARFWPWLRMECLPFSTRPTVNSLWPSQALVKSLVVRNNLARPSFVWLWYFLPLAKLCTSQPYVDSLTICLIDKHQALLFCVVLRKPHRFCLFLLLSSCLNTLRSQIGATKRKTLFLCLMSHYGSRLYAVAELC